MGVYLPIKDYSAMQGPAPSGFHIPLTTEWKAVYDIWKALGGGVSAGGNFGRALKLPRAGYRDYSNSNVSNQGARGYYWSSSRYSASSADYLNLRSDYIDPQSAYYRAFGYSVRCFKNSPTVPTSSWTKLYGTSIEAGGIFWNSTDGLISLSSDGQTWITIADKNLGATQVWNSGDTLSEANCGKYYQWGNNYGFPRTGSVTTSSTQVDASTYGPGNYYSSSTFITRSSTPYRWDSTDNGNLWGGETGVKPASLKNAYIGEVWTPGENTRIYYKFDGNLNDSSGNNNNGTAGGTVTYGTNYANLVSGYVTVPNLTYTNTYTLSFWFKCTNLSQGGYIVDGKTSSMFFRMGRDGSYYFYASTDYPSYSGVKTLQNPADNNWHLFTQTSNASGVTYYLDGVQKATSSAISSGSYTMNGMRIGKDWNGGNNNPGLYAGVFIIEDKVRTDQEIADYYNQTKANYGL